MGRLTGIHMDEILLFILGVGVIVALYEGWTFYVERRWPEQQKENEE